MIPLENALQAYVERIIPLPSETIPLGQALFRVLAEDQFSLTDLPRFDQSAMDGYALCAENTQTADRKSVIQIPVTGLSAAGDWPDKALEPGTAWRIYTGAPVPEGADTVIPQERTERQDEILLFNKPYPSGKNIRYQGEELSKGAQLATAGQPLSPGLIASLCSGGIREVSVRRSPCISVVVTGDEVRPPNAEISEGQIPDSNGTYIRAWLQANGFGVPEVTYVSDSKQSVSECITNASQNTDLVITTGGASVGDRDFIPTVTRELGYEEVFWKVAQKPGKPLFFGLKDNQPLLGLPGNPGAVLVGMEVHVRTVLNRLQGLADTMPAWKTACLESAVESDSRRDRLIRMQLRQDDNYRNLLIPLGKQDSHMLSNLGQADVLAWLPAREHKYEAAEVAQYLQLSG